MAPLKANLPSKLTEWIWWSWVRERDVKYILYLFSKSVVLFFCQRETRLGVFSQNHFLIAQNQIFKTWNSFPVCVWGWGGGKRNHHKSLFKWDLALHLKENNTFLLYFIFLTFRSPNYFLLIKWARYIHIQSKYHLSICLKRWTAIKDSVVGANLLQELQNKDDCFKLRLMTVPHETRSNTT